MEFDHKELHTIEKALRFYSEHKADRAFHSISRQGANVFKIEERKACEIIEKIEKEDES